MNKKRRVRGFSLVELLIVIAIILIIATIALPKLNRARMYAQETAAISAIKTIHTVQAQYFSQFGRYAANLVELGPPTSGQANASSADLISTDLSQGEKGGYKYVMVGTAGGYTVNANPIAYGNTGSRSFFSDQSMVVRDHYGPEPATVNDKELK